MGRNYFCKMRKIIALLSLLAIGLVGQAQTLELSIENQRLSGTDLTFDVMMRATGGTLYLGDADLAFALNGSAFSAPAIFALSDSVGLFNSNGTVLTGYGATIVDTIIGSNVIINLQNANPANQTAFDANVPRLDATWRRLGTFRITGVVSPAASPNFVWATSGNPKTVAFKLNNTGTFKSSKINSITAVNPTPVTEPVTQVTALAAVVASSTAIDLSWTAGNGSNTLILAKAASAVGTDLPADGIEYFADTTFGSGSQLFATGVYVVYNGNGTSVRVSGLTPGETYHFAAITYDGTGGQTENYNTTTPNTTSATTFLAPPTTLVAGLALQPNSDGTLTASWTANGDGDSRMVVVREFNTARIAPVNGTDYTGGVSLDFSATTDSTGLGNMVVYNGSDSGAYSIVITGLSPATRYAVEVYEYNGSGGVTESYLDPGAQADDYTFDVEPTAAPTNLAINAVTASTVDLSWTAGTGSDRTLIVARVGNAAANLPVDGVDYIANAAFGTGDSLGTGEFVVYNGNGTSVQITGLNSATSYTFLAYSLKGTGNGIENYYTADADTASGYTWAAEPTATVAGLTLAPNSDGTANVAWTSLNAGAGTNRMVVVRETATAQVVPVDGSAYATALTTNIGTTGTTTGAGNYVVYNGTGTSENLVIAGLTPSTQYTVEVYEYNGTIASTENYYSTPAAATDYTFALEPAAANNLTLVTTASSSLEISWSGSADNYLVAVSTSPITGTPVDGVAYAADAQYNNGQDTVGAGAFVAYNGAGTSVTITGLAGGTAYYYAVFAYNVGGVTDATENYAAGVQDTASTYQDEPTAASTAMLFSGIGTTGMTVSWTNGDGARRVVVAKEGGAPANAPVDGTSYTGNAAFGGGDDLGGSEFVVYDGTGSSVVVTGLTMNQTYHFVVYEYNGATGTENYLTSSSLSGSQNTYLGLQVTAVLEGPYNGTDMNQNLDTLVPNNQPYSVAPWNYAGSESHSGLPANVVDWVLVELRTGASAATADSVPTNGRKAGFLLNDGRIVATDGTSDLLFEIPEAGNYYVVVRHRTHLPVISNAAVSYDGVDQRYEYNFTTGAAQAYGTAAMVEVSTGVWGMYTGRAELTGYGIIDSDDRNSVWNARNNFGQYILSDVNLDGSVDAGDRSAVWNNRDVTAEAITQVQ